MNALEHRIPPPLVMLLTAFAMWQFARLLPRTEVDDTVRLVLAGLFVWRGCTAFAGRIPPLTLCTPGKPVAL